MSSGSLRPFWDQVFASPDPALGSRRAYARVATLCFKTTGAGRGESEFPTGVEKTVENKGFLLSQA